MPSLALAAELENGSLAQSEDDILAQTDTVDTTADTEPTETMKADNSTDTGTGLPEGWTPGRGTRAGGLDVTSYITFGTGELTGPNGTITDGDTGVTFTYGSYTFTISFAVDMAALNSALSRSGLEAGDYFTFTVPTEFKNLNFDIYASDGLVWAKVATDEYGNGKVAFTAATEGKANVSGGLSFSGSYTETTANVSNAWEFVFDHTYTFGGTSEGKDTGAPATNYVSDTENLKSGLGNVAGTNAYGWLVYVNQSAASWTGVITVSDDLGSGHKMTTYAGVSNVKYAYYGQNNFDTADAYGRTDLSNYYFGIALIDWAAMRADYNTFVQWSIANGKTTLWVDKGDGSGYVDSRYTLTAEADGITVVTTSYMRGRMIDWMDSSNNLRYVEQYTDGLDSVTVTDSGFAIEFPAGALDGKGVYMSYYSELTAIIPPAMLKNDATISGAGDDKKVTSSNTIKASGTITGTVGKIAIYKFDSNEQNRLSGAEFQLTESIIPYDDTQTTDVNGYAVFTLSTSGYAGNYTLTEITPPAGYAALDPMSITIDAAGAITEINGTAIPASAANGTIIYDSANNAICKVSPDRLYVVLYDQEEEESTTTRTVTKVWDDTNDQDGKRPTSIQVQLKADGVDYGSAVTLNAGNNWTYTWSNLPEKSSGQTVTYTVEEIGVLTGYTSSTSENGGTFIITNSYVPNYALEVVDIEGTKTWDDASDQDGKRPASITVNLLADNAVLDSKTVTASDNWEYEWIDLPKYAADVEISYTISEAPVSDYQTAVNGYDITNSYTPGETSRTVTKVWDDNNDQDGKRPASIQAQLYANGAAEGSAVTLDAANGWSYTWNNLPEKKNGTAVIYTVEETGVPTDYTAAYSTDGFTITNSYTPETVEKTVMKVWSDNNDQDGLRTDEITVQLYKDGDICGSAVILNEANNWSCTWSSLDKCDAGEEITYTVEEINVPDGYTASYSTDKFTITNTHTTAATERTVTKVWDDANNQDGLRPDSITVHLKADGVLYDTITLDESNSWTYKWIDLPLNSNGAEIIYTIVEENVDSYATAYSEDETEFTITNSYTPGIISKTVSKNWEDNSNQDGIRPDSVKVQLLADGIAYGKEVELNAGNGWCYTWQELPEKSDGTTIAYTVKEITAADGYTTTYSNDTFTITNTHTPEVTAKTVTKVWNDSNDQDGLRPDSISVQLYADGEACGDSVVLNAKNNWAYTWKDIDKNINGEAVTYTVKEVSVPSGYTASYSKDTFTITNTHALTTKASTKTTTTTSSSTKTGDDSSVFLYWLALAVSVLGICVVSVFFRKKRYTKK